METLKLTLHREFGPCGEDLEKVVQDALDAAGLKGGYLLKHLCSAVVGIPMPYVVISRMYVAAEVVRVAARAIIPHAGIVLSYGPLVHYPKGSEIPDDLA